VCLDKLVDVIISVVKEAYPLSSGGS